VDTPYIIGGDFNIIRHSGGKNKCTPLSKYSDIFNSIIHTLGLREIHMDGGLYTWSNKQKFPTMAKLDRVLMSPYWEDVFPLVQVRKLVSDLSDHSPLLLLTDSNNTNTPKNREFRFDLSWLTKDDFLPMVEEVWNKYVSSSDPVDILNIKLKRFKKHFKGWGSSLFGHTRRKKKELKEELFSMEEKEESVPLSPDEFVRKINILVELHNIYADEEIYWLQRSSEKWLLHGDQNSAYFHRVANGRRRRNMIRFFKDGEMVIEGAGDGCDSNKQSLCVVNE
jgi:hypothetical protein